MYQRRYYLEKIRPFIGLDLIKVLTGMRRAGKSVLLQQLCDEIRAKYSATTETIFMNFEDEDYASYLKAGEFHKYAVDFSKKHPGKEIAVFLDEIQLMEDWEKSVNSLRSKGLFDIYITGSNSKLLSGELASLLTGRYIAFPIFPYSFREFVENNSISHPVHDISTAFDSYLYFGGLPFLAHLAYNKEFCRNYAQDLFSSIIMKDILQRKQVRDADLLNRVVKYILSETGHVISALSIVRYLKNEHRRASVDTILDYLRYCEEAFLIHRVNRQNLRGKAMLSIDEKFYVTDHGLRKLVLGGDLGNDIAQALENVVYIELLRRGYTVTVGRIDAQEVDFACQKDDQMLYIQVAYLISEPATREREFKALAAIPDQYPKMVLSMDRYCAGQNGIAHKYLPDFLLETE